MEIPKTKEEEPLVDVSVDEAILKTWEEKKLKRDIHNLMGSDFDQLVKRGEKFILSPDNFAVTEEFIEETESDFNKFKAANLKEKMNEVKNDLRKVILNFAFQELGLKPENINKKIEEETKSREDKKFVPMSFTTNNPKNPNAVLFYDGTDWWLERKSE